MPDDLVYQVVDDNLAWPLRVDYVYMKTTSSIADWWEILVIVVH